MGMYPVAQPTPVFVDLEGEPLNNGSVYIGGANQNPETNPVQVFWDEAGTLPAAQPIKIMNGVPCRNGSPSNVYTPFGSEYSITVRDRKGRLVYTNLSTAIFSLIQFAQTGAGAVARTVQDKLTEWVSVLDFGADPTGATDSSPAFQKAVNTGTAVYVPPGTYKVLATVTCTGTLQVFGMGCASRILSDIVVFDTTSGSGSFVDNLYMENITAPWILTRDPSNWSAVPAVAQSNADGYQPTVNDSDVWGSLTVAQQTQDIGPKIRFTNVAYDICVSRIYGRFVSIMMHDTRRSVVRDCDIRGGKNFGGGIIFWNIDYQPASMNAAINNHVRYASFCGIMFAGNYDGLMQGNQIEYCGESGLKTCQGVVSGKDARCYNMQIIGNYTKYNYFDGVDISSNYPIEDTIDTRYQVVGNKTFGNRMTGFVGDGRNNQVVGNSARFNGLDGFLLDLSYSLFEGNYSQDNNQSNASSGHHEMNLPGLNNSILNNYIQADASKAGYGIYAPSNGNFIANNKTLYKANFFGSFGSSTSTLIGNLDINGSTNGVCMGDAAMMRQTAAGVPAATFYNETTSFDTVDATFHVRKNALPNPIARVRGNLSKGIGGAENGFLEGWAAQAGTMALGWRVHTNDALPGKTFTAIQVPNAAVVSGDMSNGGASMWVDEGSNSLKFVVKYSNGVVKTGSVALV